MKKLRIVLLAITAVLAVFSFSTMLAVRPGQHSAVLEAARERQRVPILSVTEPLETNTDQIAEEERIARLVADILLSDEAFIGGVSDQVEAAIPGYVTEWVQSEEFAAIMDKALEDSISEIVDRVIAELVTDENLEYVASIVAERLGTSEEEVYAAAFSRIATRVLAMLTLPDGNEFDIESAVRSLYAANRDAIISDIVTAAVAQYDALTTEEKIDLLATDEQAVEIYAAEREFVISDIVDSIIEQYNALTTEEKIALLSTDDQAVEIYANERDYIISDIVAEAIAQYDALTTEEKIALLSTDDQAVKIYANERDYIISDIVAEAIARYDALTTEEKIALLSTDDQAVEIYANERDYIISDIVAEAIARYDALTTEEKIALLSTDDQAVEIYANERDFIISDIVSAAVAEYDALTTEEKIEVLSAEDIIMALYGDNRDALMDDIVAELVSRVDGLTDEEKAALFGSADVETEVIALYEANKEYIVEEFLDIILAKYGTTPATESYQEEPEQPSEEPASRPIITVPVFDPTPSVSNDASAEEYMEARSSAREAEIARLLEYINI